MKLTKFEAEQMTEINRKYRKNQGISWDFIRFERYFHYLWELKKLDPLNHEVLDVGCGLGMLEEYLASHNYKHVSAMDLSEEGIKKTKNNVPQYDYKVGNAKELNKMYNGRLFDVIFCCQVLEHIPNYKIVLSQMYGLLNSGGVLIVSVPFERNKSSVAHCNYFYTETWNDVCKELFGYAPIVNERLTKFGQQMLVIIVKNK